jgi:hypothetical protein
MRSHVAFIKGDVAVVFLIDVKKLYQSLEHEVVKRPYTFRDLTNVLNTNEMLELSCSQNRAGSRSGISEEPTSLVTFG